MTRSERVENAQLIERDKDKIVEVWKQMDFQCTHIDVANEGKAVEIPLGPKTIGRLQERADQETLRMAGSSRASRPRHPLRPTPFRGGEVGEPVGRLKGVGVGAGAGLELPEALDDGWPGGILIRRKNFGQRGRVPGPGGYRDDHARNDGKS
jgi:hypothetical protein